jgi:anti-anti-sigma regulatory factor
MEPTYELPATLDATTVAAVQQALRALEGGAVHLDGSKVELIDTAGAQLLAAFALKGPKVHLKASAVLADFLSVTAVSSLLSLEQ